MLTTNPNETTHHIPHHSRRCLYHRIYFMAQEVNEQKRERMERFTLAAMQALLANGDWSLSQIPHEAILIAGKQIEALDQLHTE